MRIALLLTSLANSGPIIVAKDLANLLVTQGHRVSVFYFKDKIDLEFNCPTYKITFFSKFDFQAFDIIHCHGFRPDLFILMRKPLHCKTPICTTLHSYLFQDHAYKYGKRWAWLTGQLVLASTLRDDLVITLSKHAMEYYKEYLPAEKLVYAYNTRTCEHKEVATDIQHRIIDFKGNSILLGANCSLNRRKGLHQIIEVLPTLENTKFCIVGDGPEKEDLKVLAKKLDVSDRILFIGKQPFAHIFLPFYDCFVMPSYSEGFPLALLEAALYAKATACSDIPIFREILSDNETSFFELDNKESLIAALRRTIKEKDFLTHNIKNIFNEKYSPECFVNRHLEIYQQLIDKK